MRNRRRQPHGRQHRVHRKGLMHVVRRGRRAEHVRERGCRGTWEIPLSPRVGVEGRGSRHRHAVPMRSRTTATPRCLTTNGSPWYRPANERERGGKDNGKSEHSDSTDEAGELAPAVASEGKRSAGLRNRRGETQRDFVLGFVSTRL